LGIEFTVFHLSPPPGKRPHQEQESLKKRIVDTAERLHRGSGGPALYVSIFFDQDRPLTKRDSQPLARELADAIFNFPVPVSFEYPPVEIPWGFLPKGIISISVHGSIDGKSSLWQPAGGDFVSEVSIDQVAEVVRKKAKRAPRARSNCDQLWLVIVSDEFSHAAPAEISEEAVNAEYEAPFDRLVWLIPHAPSAIELRIRPPAQS
jgi:hypothetical protein